MTGMRRSMALLAATALSLSAGGAWGDEVTLKFATLAQPDSMSDSQVFTPWARHINDVAGGVLKIDLRDGFTLANFNNVYDRVQGDVVQISRGIPGLIGGKFPLTDVVGLPFVTDDAESGSIAFWRLYKTGLLDAEYKDIVPLALSVYLPTGVHLAKAPAELDDLRGLRLRADSKMLSDVLTRLGGTPIVMGPADLYPSIQRGLIDGVAIGWSSAGALHLLDVTTYHIETPLGTAATMLFMSRPTYDALPAAVRQVIDDNSGEALSAKWGANTNAESAEYRAPIAASPAHTIVRMSPAQEAKWRDAITPVIGAWEADHPGGAKILATYRALLAEVKAGR